MTREENIKWLESLKKEVGKPEHGALWHYAEAIDMAIEALQTDLVRCKDCKWHECGGLPCPLDLCESLGDDGFCSMGERREP